MKKFILLLFAAVSIACAQLAVPWADVDKTGSSLANFGTRSAGDLNSGTLPDGRFPATLPALSGLNLTALNASNLGSGTIPDARFPATLPALSGLNLTALNASNLGSGTVPTARLPAATTGAVGGVQLATNAQTLTGTSTTLVNTPAGYAYATAALRNALAPRGGVAFDGTATGRVYSALTGQNIGTDAFSVSLVFALKGETATAQDTLFQIASSASAIAPNSSIRGYVDGGNLDIELVNGAGQARGLRVTNFVTSWPPGKVVHLLFTRSGTTAKIFINGVDTLAADYVAAAAWSDSITSSFFNAGPVTSSYTLSGAVYCASLYNLALSAADVQEIYELGGAVPFRFQFGSQSERIPDTARNSLFTAAATDWGMASGGTATLDDPNDELDFASAGGGSTGGQVTGSNMGGDFAAGKRYRVGMTVSNISGGTVRAARFNSSDVFFDTTTNGTFSGECTIGTSGFFCVINLTGSQTWTIDNVTIKQVGAVVHLPLDDGIGYQLHDASTNELDAVMTTTGAAHLSSKREGYVRGTLTWSGTHEGKSLLGQQAFPSGAVQDFWTFHTSASSSGTGMTLGTTGAATRWMASNTHTLNVKEFVTFADRFPAGTAANDLDLIVDPDSANYTGSVRVQAHYRQTVGTP